MNTPINQTESQTTANEPKQKRAYTKKPVNDVEVFKDVILLLAALPDGQSRVRVIQTAATYFGITSDLVKL